MNNLLKNIVTNIPAVSLGVLLLAAGPLSSQTSDANSAAPNANQKPAKVKVVHTTQPRDGQQVFAENCERCHNAPQGFSPSISGTVIKHMRVRANLSKEDEQALMRFFNP